MTRIEIESDVLAKNVLGRLRQWGYPVEETENGGYVVGHKELSDKR